MLIALEKIWKRVLVAVDLLIFNAQSTAEVTGQVGFDKHHRIGTSGSTPSHLPKLPSQVQQYFSSLRSPDTPISTDKFNSMPSCPPLPHRSSTPSGLPHRSSIVHLEAYIPKVKLCSLGLLVQPRQLLQCPVTTVVAFGVLFAAPVLSASTKDCSP